jgi:hypothetical protein
MGPRFRGDDGAKVQIPRKCDPTGGSCASYTDAVVTPPSTTMVWPVMKLDASEPR